MFRAIFFHPQERKTVCYSMWYNAPKLLPVGGLERGGTDYVFGVKDVARLQVEQHPSHRKHSQCLSSIILHAENIVSACRATTVPVEQQPSRRKHSQCLSSNILHTENIVSACRTTSLTPKI